MIWRNPWVEQDLGIADDVDQGEALTRIDRFVCDIKEAQFADGLHVFGRMGYEGDQSLAAHSERKACAAPVDVASTLALRDHPIAGGVMFCQQGATCFLLIPYPCLARGL